MDESPKSTEKFLTLLVVIFLVVALVGLASSLMKRRSTPQVDETKYQAVFIEGNQQYFGHLHNVDASYPYLTDVYYVQGQQAPDNSGQKLTLIKSGNEIHGPEDVMYLNANKILFWENLKSDSQVVKLILQEKAQREGLVSPQPAPAPVTPTKSTKFR